jgi:hypothetical protein
MSTPRWSPSRPAGPGWLRWGLALVVAFVVTAPWLLRGYVLTYDLVFVPRPALGAGGLGLDGRVPRAVPGDFLVALASKVVRPDLLEQGILAGILVAAVLGAWRLAPAAGTLGRSAAGLLYAWNPFVYERMVLGHWALLVGYAALPWAVVAAAGLREPGRSRWQAWARLVVPLGVAAAASPTGGLLVALVAVVVLAATAGGWRPVLAGLGTAALLNAPWWLPGLLVGAVPADPTGVGAFAARADTPLGVVGSVLTFGGLWNRDTAPPGRGTSALTIAMLAVLLVAAAGAATATRRWGRGLAIALAGCAGVGLLLALAAAVPAGADVVRALVEHVPGGGLLRDAQKWAMPWVLLVAACFGPGVERVGAAVARPWGAVVTACLLVLPVAVLPSLGWGLAGRLEAVRWPEDWSTVATVLGPDAGAGDVLVLPWHQYRAWSWNGDRTVLDPIDRLVAPGVVADDDLELADRTVRGEDARVRAVRQALDAGTPLPDVARRLGVRFAVVDLRTAGGPTDVGLLLPGARLLWSGSDLAVYDLGPAAAPPDGLRAAALVVAVDVAAALLVLAALVSIAYDATRRLLRSRPSTG